MQFSSQTQITITIGAALAFVVAAIGATWNIANKLRDIRDELTEIRTELRTELGTIKKEVSGNEDAAWNKYDMRNWSFDLERQNRELQLQVPDHVTVKTVNLVLELEALSYILANR